MPAYDRIDRISEGVRRELDGIIRRDVRDPRAPVKENSEVEEINESE